MQRAPERPRRSGARRRTEGGSRGAHPQQRLPPRCAAAPLPGCPCCAPRARRVRIRAPGSCALASAAAALAQPNQRARAPPGLEPSVSSSRHRAAPNCGTGQSPGVGTRSPGGGGGALRRAGRRAGPGALSFLPPELQLRSRPGAGLPRGHRAPLPARSRPVMLPKVETEALGLARSHGDQGQMPENMQGKRRSAPAATAPGSSRPVWPGRPRAGVRPPLRAGIKVYGSRTMRVGGHVFQVMPKGQLLIK